MPNYFDCLRCSAVTQIVKTPPRCAQCGSGTGVVAKGPDGAVVKKKARKGAPEGPQRRREDRIRR